jgi:hypothetical protein
MPLVHPRKATVMTFEQFQAGRTASDNLAEAIGFDSGTPTPPKGNLYADWCLYIEQVQADWPQEARDRGEWCLTIGREVFISNDLTMLERQLYEFACAEGYC